MRLSRQFIALSSLCCFSAWPSLSAQFDFAAMGRSARLERAAGVITSNKDAVLYRRVPNTQCPDYFMPTETQENLTVTKQTLHGKVSIGIDYIMSSPSWGACGKKRFQVKALYCTWIDNVEGDGSDIVELKVWNIKDGHGDNHHYDLNVITNQQLVKKIRIGDYTVSEGGQISGTFGGVLELRFPNRGKVVERVLASQVGRRTGPTRRQSLKYDSDSIGLVAKVVSQRLGSSQINAEVRYADGSDELFVFNVESRLDAAQIERVIPFVSDVLSMEVGDDGFPLMPRVDLKGGPRNVPLDGGAKYSISQNGDGAISLVDGRIVAKRPGMAAVKVEVAGKSAELSVEVLAP